MLEINLSTVLFARYIYSLNYPSYYPIETPLGLRSYDMLLSVEW